MEIFRIGTEVNLGKNLKGKVVEVLISEKNQVQYKCVWWEGKTRTAEWVYASEVEGPYREKIQIGFR